MNATYEGERPRGWLWRLLRLFFFIAVLGCVAGGIAFAAVYATFSADLPDLDRLEDYRPPTVTRIFDQSGQIIGELYREKRIPVPYSELPPKLVAAFAASEDDRFFEHGGIDYWGILRAAVANARAGRVVQGGSTITQQVAKSLIISEEGYGAGTAKKLSRKIREAILAWRLEDRLSKREILALYLNQIFLGNQSYGVQAAAENYFRKNVRDLSVAEIALIAGLPQAPSRYSPFRHPERARRRREYVLRRMREVGIITQAELDEAEATAIRVYPAPNYMRGTTPYFTEEVRRELFERFSEDTLLDEGLRIHTTVDVERYRAAEDAVYEELRMVDKRQGYRGPLAQYPSAAERREFSSKYEKELQRLGRASQLKLGELYVGLVSSIDRKRDLIYLDIGPHRAVLPLIGMRWARKVDPQVRFDVGLLRGIPPTFSEGDALLVRKTNKRQLRERDLPESLIKVIPEREGLHVVALEQEPDLETAVLSEDNDSGYVLALLGGYSFDRSQFNRATQACRQPGSSFKPIVYSAALEILEWTPATTILDAPLAFNDARAGSRWKPNNFGGQFQGEVSMRYALKNSMNVPAIRILDAVGIRRAIKWARHLGITTDLRPELGLALGASCVKMAELVDVYRTFANGGIRTRRRMITRIEDRDGRVLFDDGWPTDPFAGIGTKLDRALTVTSSQAERLVTEDTAFLISKMMRNVVEGGTGTPARAVGVPVAGKTGTTNDSFDAWFSGFTTDITTAVWVGFDDYHLPMGRYEQGGRAALPIWVSYMKAATKKRTGEIEAPPGIVFVHIDGKTGKRSSPGARGAVKEAFKRGTEPTEMVANSHESAGGGLMSDH